MDVVSPGFFDTIGVPLLHGRDFTWSDSLEAPPVAIINATAARRLFGGLDPIGREIRIGSVVARQHLSVVGVAQDSTLGNPRTPQLTVIFRSVTQEPALARYPTLIVSGNSARQAGADLGRKALDRYGRHYVVEARSAVDQLRRATSQERLVTALASLFGALAVIVALVGLNALATYLCAMDRREFGIRLALGHPRMLYSVT